MLAGTSDLDGLGSGGRGGFPSGHAVRLGGSLRVASGVSRRYAPGVETLEQTVAREVGPEGIAKMVAAFYQKVRTDDLIGPMYPDGDWEGSEERLRDFLKFRLLGDPTYTFKRGHPKIKDNTLQTTEECYDERHTTTMFGGGRQEGSASGNNVRSILDSRVMNF